MTRSMSRWFGASVLALALGASCGSSTPAGTGGVGQGCYANATCNSGLACLSKLCVVPPDGGGASGGAGGGGGVVGTSGAAGTGGSMAGTSGGDAAAGMSGADAAAGTTGQDAAAETSGADAAAGTGGADAAAGTSGGDAAVDTSHADAGGESIVNCGLDTTWGPFTFTDGIDFAVESMPASAAGSYDEVDWDGFLGASATTTIADILQVSLFSGSTPFGATLTTMPAIDLSIQTDLETCGACVFLVLNADTTNPRNLEVVQLGPDYVATSGTLDLTQVPAFPATASSHVSGMLSNVVFEHMNVDPTTFATTPAGDGCKFTLSAAAFDVVVTNQ